MSKEEQLGTAIIKLESAKIALEKTKQELKDIRNGVEIILGGIDMEKRSVSCGDMFRVRVSSRTARWPSAKDIQEIGDRIFGLKRDIECWENKVRSLKAEMLPQQ